MKSRRAWGIVAAGAVVVVIAARKLRGLRKFTNLILKRGYGG